ncbi:MAG: hypothetical protein ACR2RL_16210 [Gammaproteobacteria bacterium]
MRLTEGVPGFDYSAAVWGSPVGLAWFATAFAYLLYFGILRRAGAANSMLVALLIPPFAVGLDLLVGAAGAERMGRLHAHRLRARDD